MTLNFMSPARVVTTYQTSDGFIHSCGFYVKPATGTEAQWSTLGEPMGFYPIVSRDGVTIATVADAINEFWHGAGGIALPDGFRTMFHTSTTFLSTALYKYDAGTNIPQWVSEADFDFAGTSIIATTLNSQHTWVGKTKEGGIARLVFMDVGSGNVTSFVSRGAFNANQTEMAWALTHEESFIVARDGSSWANVRGFWGGQNEAIFKKRNRP